MTKNELRDLILQRYSLVEDGEGDAPIAGGADASAGAAPVATTTSNISSSMDNSSTSSSSDSYTKDDVLFGDNNSSSGGPDDSFGGVASGSGDFAPLDNPFKQDQDNAGQAGVAEPAKYEVLGFVEKDPEYPDEKDYLKVRDIDTKEIKIFPLSQIDMA